jgi:hypothetical protein
MCCLCSPSSDQEDARLLGNKGYGAIDEGCDKPKPTVDIVRVTIVSISFRSDHALLTDYNTDWEDGGNRYQKPEWPYLSQDPPPVTHTMDQTVTLRLQIQVEPDNATATQGTLVGTATGMTFTRNGALAGGLHSIDLTSNNRLAKRIRRQNFPIAWGLTLSGGRALDLGTTQHRIFVTMGRPTTVNLYPGITLKRMNKAVSETKDMDDPTPHALAARILGRWQHYDPHVAHRNAWELEGDQAGADCQTMVRYTEYVLKMVGCPGAVDWIVVWGRAGAPTVGVENLGPSPHMTEPVQWYKDVVGPTLGREKWHATLQDGGGVFNRYEACLKVAHGGTTRYYAGGAGVHNDADSVLGVFRAMVWKAPKADNAWEDEWKADIHSYR